MNYIQILAYAGFWLGAVIMINIHNLIASILLCRIHKVNVSTILKIIFTFGQIVQSVGNFGIYMTPETATFVQCAALQYFISVGNIITRLSLSAFLLWRLRQLDNNKKSIDKLVCIVLFTIRAAFTIPYLIFQQPSTKYDLDNERTICNINNNNPQVFSIGEIVIDFLIDIYVIIHLILIFNKANNNKRTSSNVRSKRTIFTAVMYWNFLRLIISFVFHFMSALDTLHVILSEVASITIENIIYIALSYVITIDAEIVNVTEKKERSLRKTEKSKQNSHTMNSSDDISTNFNQTQSQFDENKIVVVSMKKLTFYEWANLVTGDNDDNDEDRRNSSFSDTTLTEKSNVDIIIN